jgi:hypothetical protein
MRLLRNAAFSTDGTAPSKLNCLEILLGMGRRISDSVIGGGGGCEDETMAPEAVWSLDDASEDEDGDLGSLWIERGEADALSLDNTNEDTGDFGSTGPGDDWIFTPRTSYLITGIFFSSPVRDGPPAQHYRMSTQARQTTKRLPCTR